MWRSGPRFTYHGFRYVEVTGLSGEAELEQIEGAVVHTSAERTASFECSDCMLNRIYSAAIWTIRGNIHGIPTDCPHRERCGWTGDAHIMAETVNINFGMANFWRKYVRDIETSFHNGLPTNVAPGRRMKTIARPDWGAAIVLIPWYNYRHYRDVGILKENYEHMKRYVEYLGSIAKDGIITKGYGDWYDPPLEGPEARSIPMPKHTPVPLTSTAYYYLTSSITAEVAGLLDKSGEERRYRELAEKVKRDFNERFYEAESSTYGSQTADAIALSTGLAEPANSREVVESLIEDIVKEHDCHFTVGMHGRKYLHEVLSDKGYGYISEKILRNKDYPSIGYLFSLGATTLWENWSTTANHAGAPRSHNHPMNTSFATWFHRCLGGIRAGKEGWCSGHFIIKPDVRNHLKFVKAACQSPYGKVSSYWCVEGDRFRLSIEVPVNTSAKVYVPAVSAKEVTESGLNPKERNAVEYIGMEGELAVYGVGGGCYNFESVLPEDTRKFGKLKTCDISY